MIGRVAKMTTLEDVIKRTVPKGERKQEMDTSWVVRSSIPNSYGRMLFLKLELTQIIKIYHYHQLYHCLSVSVEVLLHLHHRQGLLDNFDFH